MEKVVNYKNSNYKVVKVGDNVTVQKEVDGNYVDLTYDELQEFLTFINSKAEKEVVSMAAVPKEEISNTIFEKIQNGEIKTFEEIEEQLKNAGLSEEDYKKVANDLNEALKAKLATDMSVEELNNYASNIEEAVDRHSPSEAIYSEFNFVNGLLEHRMMVRDLKTGEVRTLTEQKFEYNELVIENLIMASLKSFRERNEILVNDYEVESNLIESTSNYSFVGEKNCTMVVKSIPLNLSEKLKKLAEDTQKLTNGKDEEPEPGMPQYDENGNIIGPNTDEEYAQSQYNDIQELDENGMPKQLDEPLKLVRKKPNNQGFMGLKFLIIGLIVLAIGLFLLTKFVLLK